MKLSALPNPPISSEPNTSERLAVLLSNAPVILFETDVAGTLTLCEGRVLQEIGVPPSRLLGRPIRELCKDYPWLVKLLDEAFEGGECADTGRAGHVWYQVRCTPLRGEQGELQGIIGVATDVTVQKMAEQDQTFLREASSVLSRSLNRDEILANLTDLSVPALGTFCLVELPEEQKSALSVSANIEPQRVEALKALRSAWAKGFGAGPDPFTAVYNTRKPLILNRLLEPGSDEKLSNEVQQAYEAAKPGPAMILPLLAGGGCLGTLTIGRPDGAPAYNLSDIRLASELANMAAYGIEHSRLFTEANEARIESGKALARANFYAEVSRLLSSSLDLSETLGAIARLAVPAMADYCFVLLREADGIRPVAVAHIDAHKQLDLEQNNRFKEIASNPTSSLSQVMATGKPMLETMNEDFLQRNSASTADRERLLKVNPRSSVFAPLVCRDEILGVVGLVYSDSDRRHSPSDLSLAEEIGRRAGQAIENATLYRKAQHAVRDRDEFLSVASHELKTPATALQSLLELLLRANRTGRPQSDDQVRKMVESAHFQVQRLVKLLNNLLDVSRISVDRLTLFKARLDLAELTRGVVERLETEARHGHTTIRLETTGPVFGRWDPERIEQVCINLVTNAIRYGLERPIDVRVFSEGELGIIEVEDRGIGICPEHHHKIFERFERNTAAHSRSGLGLGLFIVKQIVDAHQGHIRLRSAPGKGSLFRVEIPLGA
ncbi:MAG TPA: ATP-binding protein [Bdellovibrionota bacterium]|nr:ATP-binding protein [Bdellovibrionota bacterium]